MNFEVNGTSYFLAFDVQSEQWRLLTPSADGIGALEIHSDGKVLPPPPQPRPTRMWMN